MSAPDLLRHVFVALALVSGQVAAEDAATVASNAVPNQAEAVSSAQTGMVPPVMLWPQMMPVARPMVYYWAPPPNMMWPVLPQYPSPMVMPPVVWVMVPVPASSLVPAGVDYGPVADTPVVELPVPDSVPEQVVMQDSAPSSPASVDYGPVAETPVVAIPEFTHDMDQAGLEEAALAAALAQEAQSAAGTAAAASTLTTSQGEANEPSPTEASPPQAPPVDYGPVTPTPIVDLLALEAQAAETGEQVSPKAAAKPVRKSGTPASPKPVAQKKSAPVKRMCWSKGVVAPCR